MTATIIHLGPRREPVDIHRPWRSAVDNAAAADAIAAAFARTAAARAELANRRTAP